MSTTPQSPAKARPDRFLIGIVAGAIALSVAGLALALLGRGPRPSLFAPDSPPGVVTGYVEALRGGESDRAYTFLSSSAKSQIPLDRFQRETPRYGGSQNRDDRVLVEPLTEGGDSADVRVSISSFSTRTDPFSSSTYHRDVTFKLVREGGAWKIAQPSSPWAVG